ncbi:MAG: hypothetical protein ACT4O2_15715 [Beijerinckiaceae bacterium]
MRSFTTISRHLITYAATLRARFLIFTVLAGAVVAVPGLSAIAAPLHQGAWIITAPKEGPHVVETRFRGGRVGVRGGGAWRGGAVVRRGGAWGYRGGAVVRRGGATVWRRPGSYWWPAGGAIAAGAAIGVVSAAAAATWAGAAPAPGYCWYYTDPSQRQGFWDVCR